MSTATAAVVTISVTQEHIGNGVRGNCALCPVASAFRASVPGATDASVTHHCATVWTRDGTRTVYALPAVAREFIGRFDARLPVEPFTFEVTP